ncbi:MAG: hypothetical protein ACRCVT_01925 [Leadbetterella sp.]
MKNIRKITYLFVLLLLMSQCLYAQNTKIVVQKTADNVVKLRWAMDSPSLWSLGTTNGYYIKREKLNGTTVVETTWMNGGNVIMPLGIGTTEQNNPWASYLTYTVVNGDTVLNFPNQAAMMGAIYGDSIDIGNSTTTIQGTGDNTSLTTVTPPTFRNYDSTKLAQKHFTAMIVSEMSFDAARLGGLGYVDNSVLSNGTYRYSVYMSNTANTPPNVLPSGCASLTLNAVLNITNNILEKCYEITLDENFEADPGINYEFVAEALAELPGANNTPVTPPSVGTALTVSDNILIDNSGNSLPAITIFGEYPATKNNVIKWVVPENTPYSKYDLYRSSSDNPTVFKRINPRPIIQLNESSANAADTLYYSDVDTTKSIFKTYTYKVRGTTLFDEIGPYSNLVSGRSVDAIVVVPRIDTYTIDDSTSQTQVTVRFNYDLTAGLDTVSAPVKNEIILRYEIERSRVSDTLFSTVLTSTVKTATQLLYTVPSTDIDAFYLRLKVSYTGNKEPSYSQPVMIQLADRTPPSIPVISVVNDYPIIENDKAVVKLRWLANTELDFFGYRIFRKNFSSETAMNITNEMVSSTEVSTAANADSVDSIMERNAGALYKPILENGYYYLTDYVSSTSLNDSIYYQIMSVDKRFNQSQLSVPFGVARPNTVPPVIPVFLTDSISSSRGAVYLEFSISKDPDITSMQLFRTPLKSSSTVNLAPIATFLPIDFGLTDTLKQKLIFIDTSIVSGESYTYLLRVVDRYLPNQDFISERPLIVEVPVIVNTGNNEPIISAFSHAIQRNPNWITLNWTHSSLKVREYIVYKGSHEGVFSPTTEEPKIPVKSWKELPADYKTFKDKDVKGGFSYRYMIKAIYTNGSFSDWKEISSIDF